MKDYPLVTVKFQLHGRTVTAELPACPWCGEPVYQDRDGRWDRLASHDSCLIRNWERNPDVISWTSPSVENASVYARKDADGDWWLVFPERDYEVIEYYLVPTNRDTILTRLSNARKAYLGMLLQCEAAEARVG